MIVLLRVIEPCYVRQTSFKLVCRIQSITE